MDAPIWRNGATTLRIGLRRIEPSPVMVAEIELPAS
jgi:hypothetical protein